MATCALVAGWIVPLSAVAVCRVVEPAEDSGEGPVVFDPTTTTVFVLAPDQVVDWLCPATPEGMAGAGEDLEDAGAHAAAHAGVPRLPLPMRVRGRDPELGHRIDAGMPPVDAGFDPSVCSDGSAAEPVNGTLVHFVLQPAIYANGGTAGLIMPVPARADVHVAPADLFVATAALQRARVEETLELTEDPGLGYQCYDPHYGALDDALAAPLMLYGCGEAGGDYYRPGLERYETDSIENEGGVVELERIPATEDYEVTMLNASSLEALTIWLDDNQLRHTAVDDAAFSHYVREGAWFMAVKVTPRNLDGVRVALAPLVVTWRGESIPIMNRLQYQPGGGMLFTDAFVLAPRRMRAADGDGDTLYAAPVHLGAEELLAGFGLEEGWLTRIQLTRRTHIEKEDSELVPVLHWASEVRPVLTRRRSVRIAAACCEGGSIPSAELSTRTTVEHRSYLEGEEPVDEYFRTTPPPAPEFCPGGASYSSPYDDSGYGGSGYAYGCTVDARDRRRLAALLSWAPLLFAFGLLIRRASRKRRR